MTDDLKRSSVFHLHIRLLLGGYIFMRKRGETIMKNDTKKVELVTSEMSLNDFNYAGMQKEYDDFVFDISIGIYVDDIEAAIDKAYFYRRVLSVLSNNDIPLRAAIGIFDIPFVLEKLYKEKEKFIGELDADTDIYEYVLEYGYRAYEKIKDFGDYGSTPEDILKNLMRAIKKCAKELKDDDE